MEDARDRFVNVFLFVYPYCRMRCRYCVDGLTNKAAEISRDDVMTIIRMLGEHGARGLWLSGGKVCFLHMHWIIYRRQKASASRFHHAGVWQLRRY